MSRFRKERGYTLSFPGTYFFFNKKIISIECHPSWLTLLNHRMAAPFLFFFFSVTSSHSSSFIYHDPFLATCTWIFQPIRHYFLCIYHVHGPYPIIYDHTIMYIHIFHSYTYVRNTLLCYN